MKCEIIGCEKESRYIQPFGPIRELCGIHYLQIKQLEDENEDQAARKEMAELKKRVATCERRYERLANIIDNCHSKENNK